VTASDTQTVVTEFGGNRVSMAAEILRLRQRLDEVRFDLSRAAAMGVSGLLIDPMPPADVTPRPVGFRTRR
jgi:hypothetical protein